MKSDLYISCAEVRRQTGNSLLLFQQGLDDLYKSYIWYMSCIFSWPTLCKTCFSDVKGLQRFFPHHVPSQPIDEQNLAKHASEMIESTPCHHDLHGFTTEMLVWVGQTSGLSGPSPQEAPDSFNMDFQNELTDLTSSQNHSKYIRNIHQFGLLRDYPWNSSIEMFAKFKIIKLAQLIFARFSLIQLDLPKTCAVNLPFFMIGEQLSHQLQTYPPARILRREHGARTSSGCRVQRIRCCPRSAPCLPSALAQPTGNSANHALPISKVDGGGGKPAGRDVGPKFILGLVAPGCQCHNGWY